MGEEVGLGFGFGDGAPVGVAGGSVGAGTAGAGSSNVSKTSAPDATSETAPRTIQIRDKVFFFFGNGCSMSDLLES
jgi:hypothetical protein